MMEHIPFVAHEADMTRMERINRKAWILCVILIVLLFGTNVGWLLYESQFEYYEITQDVDTKDGGNAIVNGNGVMNYGACETDNEGKK